ncbi:hypothetical protein WME91_50295 [Sorangium sp. So ce269]
MIRALIAVLGPVLGALPGAYMYVSRGLVASMGPTGHVGYSYETALAVLIVGAALGAYAGWKVWR